MEIGNKKKQEILLVTLWEERIDSLEQINQSRDCRGIALVILYTATVCNGTHDVHHVVASNTLRYIKDWDQQLLLIQRKRSSAHDFYYQLCSKNGVLLL